MNNIDSINNNSIVFTSSINPNESIQLVGSQLIIFKGQDNTLVALPNENIRIHNTRTIRVPLGFFAVALDQYHVNLEHFMPGIMVQSFLDILTSIFVVYYECHTSYNEDTDCDFTAESADAGFPSYKIRHFHL